MFFCPRKNPQSSVFQWRKTFAASLVECTLTVSRIKKLIFLWKGEVLDSRATFLQPAYFSSPKIKNHKKSQRKQFACYYPKKSSNNGHHSIAFSLLLCCYRGGKRCTHVTYYTTPTRPPIVSLTYNDDVDTNTTTAIKRDISSPICNCSVGSPCSSRGVFIPWLL